MTRRLLVALGALLLALFFVPQLPPVRDALLRWGAGLAARQGYTVTYRESAGNLLYNLKLTGLSVTGQGVDVRVDTLGVGYTLPALVTGTLPLCAEVSGVRGTLDLDALLGVAGGARDGPQAAPRRARIRPVLARAELSGVALDVQGAPFDVPDAELTSLEVRQDGDTLAFDAALAVQDAVAEVSGRAALAPFSLSATVARADVALAKSFFDGAEGGTLSGTVQADGDGVEADLELQNGQVEVVGLDLESVSGPVRVRGKTLTTELTGRALGGPLAGAATVDFAARHWEADVTGDARLAEALGWLGEGRLPAAVVEALGPSGRADVSLKVGGWQRFTLEGAAAGRGELLGEPLTDLDVDFGFETDVGTTVTADARLGGAPLSFSLTPRGKGFTLEADGTNLPLRGFLGDVAVDLRQQGGALTGTADLNVTGTALGRAVQARARATTDGEAWRVGLTGRDALGARASGALELQAGRLDGAVRVTGLELPGLEEPVTVTARADGQLTELPVRVRVAGPGGVRVAAGGVRAEADFSGTATATLEEGTLRAVRGDFGPLSVSGTPGDLRYVLAPTALGGRASGRVALRGGRLTREDGRLETTARLAATDLRGAGVTLPDLDAGVSLTRGDTLTAAVTDPDAGVEVQLQGGALRGTLNGARVGALGDTFAVTGDVSGRAADLSETLALDLRARTPGSGPGTTLRAVGDARRTRLSLQSDAGATLAGRTLGGALELSGNASLAERSAELSGTLGGVGVEVAAAPDAAGRVRAQAGLRAGGDTFTASFDSLERWETDGTLPLRELGNALGLPLRGSVRTTLARQGSRFSGQAEGRGRAFGLPFRVDAAGRDGALTLTATASLLGQPLTLSGRALPDTDATLRLGPYGQVRLSGTYPALSVTGSGRVPGFNRAGLVVPTQRWTLRGDLGAGRAQLQVGDSSVRTTRGPNGWRLDAQLEQRAAWRGTPLVLEAAVTRTPQRPAGRIEGTLALGGSPLTLSGTLRDLNVNGSLPAGALQPGLLGRVGVEANVDAFARTYDAALRWRRPDGTQALQLTVEGQRGVVSAIAQADGLNARFSTASGAPTWRLGATRFALSSLPVRSRSLQGLNARLGGTLSARDGYTGRLRLTSDVGTAQLNGTGAGLNLTAAAERGGLKADVSGTLLPDLELSLRASAGDAASLIGSLTGALTRPQLRATLQTAAQNLGGGQLRVPARRLELRASLDGGLSAALSAQGTDVRLREGRWGGRLALPFTLRGLPHRLAGTVEGTPAAPTFAADLSGPVVRGPLTLSRDGFSGDLAVTPDLAAVPDARLGVQLRATPDLRWQVDLEGTTTLPYRAVPATLRGRVEGDGARYTGTGTLTVAGEAVPLTLSGEAAHVQARAALEDVRLNPFVPARGTVSGDVRVATNGALRYFANLSAAGTAAGRPFDLTLSADRESGLNLSGSAAGASVTLTGPLPFSTLTLNVADSEQPLELAASLELGETLTLQGGGAWRGEALRVTGAYTPDPGDGTLELTLDDASLTATLEATGVGRRLRAAATAPTGLLNVETPLSLDAVLMQTDETLAVTNLDARFGAATLSAAGTVQPQPDVSGTLVVPAAGEPVALRLTALETGYLAALTQGTLELRSVLKPTFVPERARLVGTLSRPDLGLESDLVWQEGAGFSGRADLTLSRGENAATLALVGETGLRVRGGARVRGVPVAALSARLSDQPWRDRRLAGTLSLDAPAHDLVPAWSGDPLRLRGRLGISGDLTAPRLAGPITLSGALVAAGRIQADREGARVSLSGPGLSAVGSVGASGYRGTLSLDALDLSGVVPQPAASDQSAAGRLTPALSGAVRATRTWGSPPQAQADLRLVSGESAVRGRARLAEAFSGALELDVRLRDFSPELRGQVSGPLRLTAQGPLSGALTLRNLGPAADWGLGGTLELSGSLESPVVGAVLAGTGSADGALRATFAPRSGRLELTSDLALLGAETDLTLTRTRTGVSGGGTLRYGDFGARLRTEEGRVVAAGTARLHGWHGLYGRERFSLRGPLGSLNPQLSGRLELRGPADLSALEGSLTGAAFGPVGLGEVALEARARRLTLRGERLEAAVGLSPDLPWTLTRLDPALPGGLGVTASGAGTRTGGNLAGILRAGSLELPVTARYTPQALALRASGALPVGALDLRARYENGWQGRLNVTDEGRRVVDSTLSGPLAAPTLAGRLGLIQGESAVRGNFTVGRDAARLEVRLSSPQLSAPLTVSGAGWPLDLTLATPVSAVQLSFRGGRLRPSGALELGVGPTDLTLRADEGRLRLSARVPAAPGLALRTTLPRELGGYAGLLDGVRFTGAGRTRGTLTVQVRPTPRLTAEGLAWRTPAGTLSVTGGGSLGGAPASATNTSGVRGQLRGRWRGAKDASLPGLRNADVPFTAQAEGGRFSLTSASDLGRAAARFDAAAGRLTLTSDLALGRGRVAADVRYTRADGPAGTVRLESVPVFTFGESVATLGSRITLTPGGVSGRGALSLAGGQADLSGEAGWARLLPAPLRRLAPEGGDALSAQVRLERFELGGVPQVAARLPYLDAPVSGVATLTGAQLVGQLVAPELRVLETPLPTQVEFNGTLRALEARASFADSRLSVRYTRERGATVAGLVTLEGFPLQTLAEAAVGASQVEATVTGAARFEVPLSAPRTGYVRLATERLSLRNTGTEGDSNTQGEVALRFEDGSLFVERAEFRGDGFWRANGILTPEELDFTLQAQNADFTPLLSLVPRLAAFNVGARGSLNMQASGSLSAPNIALISPRLEVSVAGSRYRALDTQASLSGGAFGLRSDVVGVAPITGRLDLRGSGQVNLAPFVTSGLAFSFSGDAAVPTVGRVEDLEGRIYPSSRGWQLEGGGTLGRPFTVSGDLAPLDLTLTGEDLNIRARRLFVASSTTDVTLNVRSDALDFVVSGDALVQQAQLSLNRREGASAQDTASRNATAQGTATQDAAEDAEARDPTPQGLGAESSAVATIGSALRRTTNPVLERVRFEDVRLRAPQEVIVQEAFGNAELSLDLTLSGTAATPRLDGEARTLRGSIRFSGQDFTLTRAVATFDPSQGVYPTLEVEAVATFDKSRALGGSAREAASGAAALRFVEPSDSSFFDVQLTLTGSFEESLGGRRALDLEPTLTSNTLVQEGATGAPRPLTEAELVALLTLGRLQLDAPISADALIGGNSLAGTVAESALDTAVDLLVVSELQDALGEALGVDLLEIRTSALSTFLGADGGEQNFGVSVRVGGYLADDLFASVQVGRYDDPDQNVALSNEFLLRYTAAPLELNLSGGVDFLEQRAVTDFSLGLSYAVTPLISLDASLETTALGQDTSVGFGVSFTW